MSSPEMNYNVLLEAIGQAHQQAQAGAAGAVNRHLILRNWVIGAYLVEFEQNGKDRAQYGAGLLKRLSKDLCKRGMSGASPDVLERMRLFFQMYPQFTWFDFRDSVAEFAPAGIWGRCCHFRNSVAENLRTRPRAAFQRSIVSFLLDAFC